MQNKSKKILILGSNEDFTLERMYFRGFKAQNCKVDFYNVYRIRKNFVQKIFWKYFRNLYLIVLRYEILRKLNQKKNYYDLIVIFKGLFLNKEFLIKCKSTQLNSIWINIFPDDPFIIKKNTEISNQGVLDSIIYFDKFFTFSNKILKKLRKKYIVNIFDYLPFGNDDFYHKKSSRRKKNYDISFIGTADSKRYVYLKNLSDFKLIIGGDGWNKFKLSKNVTYVGNVDNKKFSELINLSHLSLNILRDQNDYSHNMKTFEIPAMGGLMITKRTKEQKYFFPENKACLMYSDLVELKTKIRKVLKNPKKFHKVSKKAYKLSKYYSYKNRAKQILNSLSDND